MSSAVKMLKQKDYKEITVLDLVADSGVNRNTFYYHFKDKYDLTNWIFDTEIAAPIRKRAEDGERDVLLELCRMLYRDRMFYSSIFRVEGQNSFGSHFWDALTEAVKELSLLNEKTERIEEQISVGRWQFDTRTKVFRISRTAGIILKQEGRDTIPLSEYALIIHSADREMLLNKIMAVTSGTGPFIHRTFIDGEIRYLQTQVTHVEQVGGERIIEGYIQDITRIIEERDELEKARYAINNIYEEVYAFDGGGDLLYANDRAIKQHNLTGDFYAYTIWDLYSDYTPDLFPRLRKLLKEGNGSQRIIAHINLKDGKNVHYETYCHLWENEGEEIFWFFSRDVSVRIRQEHKIKELNRIMNSVLDNIPVYLFVKDTGDDFRYLYWNKAFESYSHIPAEKAIGHTDSEPQAAFQW